MRALPVTLILLLVPFTLIPGLAHPEGAGCTEPPAGLIHWWSADGDATDRVGAAHGDLVGGAGFASGLFLDAFQLDGEPQYVDLGHDAGNFSTADFTVSLWVRFDTLAGEQILIERYIEGGPPSGWTLAKLSSGNLRLAGATGAIRDVSPGFAVDVWHAVTVTREAALFRIHVDAMEKGNALHTVDLDTTSTLKLGHRGGPGDTPGSTDGRGFYLRGSIDEVQFFDRALTPAEISLLHDAGVAGPCNNAPDAQILPLDPTECLGGGADLVLDGLPSSDADDDALGFTWDAPGVILDDPTLPVAAGRFPLGETPVHLIVSDPHGATDVATALAVVEDLVPPTVELQRPREGHAYLLDNGVGPTPGGGTVAVGPLTVEAAADDACGVTHVLFEASTGESFLDDAAPYAFTLTPPLGFAEEIHITATATDLSGQTATDTVSYTHVGTAAP